MREKLKMLLAVLDGRPTRMRGQSMVELALTLPIFVIMLTGLVEVGWFANNYLILNDTVRTAGRYGSVREPREWNETDNLNWNRLDCDFDRNTYNKTDAEYVTTFPTTIQGAYSGPETTRGEGLGFYDGVACSIIANMAPLQIKDLEDDIIISVFSYANFPDCDFNPTNGEQPCVKVTGRYPTRQNECPNDYRDPFDFITNGTLDEGEDETGYDSTRNEGKRGFIFRGNQYGDAAQNCLGSRFDLRWLENQLQRSIVQRSEATVMSDVERCFIPSYGMVLVEIWWNSYHLIGLPFVEWMGNPIRIHTWAIFPAPAVTPEIDLDYEYCEPYID